MNKLNIFYKLNNTAFKKLKNHTFDQNKCEVVILIL